jgi:hypothetical protein
MTYDQHIQSNLIKTDLQQACDCLDIEAVGLAKMHLYQAAENLELLIESVAAEDSKPQPEQLTINV